MSKKSIVILGAGFGGMRTALSLGRMLRRKKLTDRYEIILVDRNRYHTYTPTLYEIATTDPETANYCDLKGIVTFSIEKSIAGLPIRFLQADIAKIDVVHGDIHHSEGMLRFDYLVLALGSETNYFGIPGAREYSLSLKSFLDAVKLRDKIAELRDVREPRIVIAGGGSTGVELASEIKEARPDIAVTIVEMSPTILPGFREGVLHRVLTRLRKLGVALLNGEKILRVEPREVFFQSGTSIPFDLLVWTGGTRMPNLISAIPLKAEARGRLEVAYDMACLPSAPDQRLFGSIYAIGDITCVYNEHQKPVPGVAHAAILQADVAAKNIVAQILEAEGVARTISRSYYEPEEYPYIIPVGGKHAVASIGPLVVGGYAGWILKGLVELRYLISIMPFWMALKIWIKGFFIFIRNDKMG